ATAGGAILAVAGWDGTTTSPSALTTGTAYGNHGGSIIIGGTGQDGNVDIGSATESTTLAGDNVSLTANNGYVQVGYNGAGSGAIDVVALGNATLTAGTEGAEFAQIGNGGWNTFGNESGNITVDASGNVVLDGGSGQETYAQIGHGGTASISGSEGYSDIGLITVDGKAVTLAAGSSQGSYAQIGNGGYLSGQNLAGTATLGGDITVNAVNSVSLAGGGEDAYAQIGNGGALVNSNAANGAGGTISGDIVVAVASASDPITVTAGSGAQSYAQIGNGGYGENMPASGATVNFAVSGNVSISDLTLTGSDTGADGYAQIGNGDASKTGTGDISGDITIGPGQSPGSTWRQHAAGQPASHAARSACGQRQQRRHRSFRRSHVVFGPVARSGYAQSDGHRRQVDHPRRAHRTGLGQRLWPAWRAAGGRRLL
ncbi:MAG: hypothetical protein ABSC92_13480, partial [Rhizomicrobium sp.]